MKSGSLWITSGLLVGLTSTAGAAGKVSLTIADVGGALLACKAEAVDSNNKVVQAWPKMYSRATFSLAPGKYSFVCRLPGYAEGRVGPVDIVEGKESLQQIKVSKVSTQQGALKKPTGTLKPRGAKGRWGLGVASKGLAPSKGAMQKSGTPAAPTGPTGKIAGKITAAGSLTPCRGMEVKAANGAVMPISWRLTSRYQLDLPAGEYSLTCTPVGTFPAATVKATIQAGKTITVDFTLQKR